MEVNQLVSLTKEVLFDRNKILVMEDSPSFTEGRGERNKCVSFSFASTYSLYKGCCERVEDRPKSEDTQLGGDYEAGEASY
jgi:hypothetical protein